MRAHFKESEIEKIRREKVHIREEEENMKFDGITSIPQAATPHSIH